jgi:hypothetical protein
VVRQGRRPVIPGDLPEAVKSLINMCWAQDPSERPAFVDVVKMLEQIRAKIMEINQIVDDTQFTKLV